MIGKLKGLVDAVGESHALIDVNGVGYEVQCSARTLRNLEAGQAVSLVVDTHVREDSIRLFGFTSEVERSWFRTLQSVQGVGSKVALGVLGTLSTGDLASAIAFGAWQTVEQAPGVGRKLAQRIVIELKDKAPALGLGTFAGPEPGKAVDATGLGVTAVPLGDASAEAISALVNLGYQPAQAGRAIAAALHELGAETQTAQLIRRGLRELAR